ncbi:MAG: DUF2846 domain-containing protein [Ferruginibacter sp.]|nr:DUF2846 domain-containing protein [Cytophagales bacterium]
MKKMTLLIGVSTFLALAGFVPSPHSVNEAAPTIVEDATVYIYRGGQAFSAGLNYVVEANGNKICRLSNNKYIEYKTAPGKINFTAHRGGVEILKKETGIDLDVEAGKKYYIKCDVKSSITRTRLEMSEVTANTGERDLQKLKPDTCMEEASGK